MKQMTRPKTSCEDSLGLGLGLGLGLAKVDEADDQTENEL